MKIILTLSLLIAGMAHAQKTTPIKADYSCEQPGGLIAFKTGADLKTAKAWQADLGDEQGLEIKLSSFTLMRCPGCYAFAGKLGTLKVRATITNFVLKYEAFDLNEKLWTVVMDGVDCHQTRLSRPVKGEDYE